MGKAGAYNNIGYIYMINKNWGKAERAFKKALESDPVFYPRAKANLERLQRLRDDQYLQKVPGG